MVGASVGFLADHHGRPALHSHVTGVADSMRHAGIGRAHQAAPAGVGHRPRARVASPGPSIRWCVATPGSTSPCSERRSTPTCRRSTGRCPMPSMPVTTPTDCSWPGTCSAAVPPRPGTGAIVGSGAEDVTLIPTPSDVVELRRTDRITVAIVAAGLPDCLDDSTRCRPTSRRLHPRRPLCDRTTPMTTTLRTLERVELRRISLPLVSPFRTSFGVQTDRDVLLVSVELADSSLWRHRRGVG